MRVYGVCVYEIHVFLALLLQRMSYKGSVEELSREYEAVLCIKICTFACLLK